MKKGLLFTAMLAVCTCVGAQSISTKVLRERESSASSSKLEMKQNVNAVATSRVNLQKSKLKASTVKQVIASKQLKSGNSLQIAEMENGMVVKRIQNPARQAVDKVLKRNSAITRAETRATTPVFFEGFEGWDGEAFDWIPAGWVDESKAGHVAVDGETNLTWTTTGAGFVAPTEGDYMGRVQVSIPSEEAPAQTQDEWLITPSFTPQSDNNLYFDMNYSPGWMLLDLNSFQFTASNTTLEVQISEDNGVTWAKVFDALDEARKLTEDELWDDLYSYGGTWLTIKINLSAYVDKEIKVAFRYVGIDGESICLDAVTVTDPSPEALYVVPSGYFYYGMDENYSFFATANAVLGPAYEEARWYNYSNFDSEAFNWQFTDPTFESAEPVVLTDINPTIEYPYAIVDVPTLEASAVAGKYTSSYQWGGEAANLMMTGGGSTYTFSGQTEPSQMGAGNYDNSLGFTMGRVQSGGYVFGTNNAAFWAPFELDAIANFYEKPLHEYMVERFWIHAGNFAASPDAELTLTIRRVNDLGQLTDTIATSVCYANEVIHAYDNGGTGYYSIPFTFKTIDPETGREVDTFLEIKDAIFVEMKGFTDGTVTSLAPFFQYYDHPSYNSYAYVYLNRTVDGQTTRSLYSAPNAIGAYTSFLFNMDAVYPWMFADENRFEAPVGGGTKNFNISTYFVPESWYLTEELPGWITLGTVENLGGGVCALPVTAAALGSEPGRYAEITVRSYASEVKLVVTQGDVTGVSTETVSVVNAVRNGDNFELSYPAEMNAVTVINAAGQVVASYKLSENGKFSVPTANLSKGLYILKFNGEKSATVKILK